MGSGQHPAFSTELRQQEIAEHVGRDGKKNQGVHAGQREGNGDRVEANVADPSIGMHYQPVDPEEPSGVPSGGDYSGQERTGVLGNRTEATTSSLQKRTQVVGQTNTRSASPPLSTGAGTRTKRAITSGEEPRTTTGPTHGTGVAI
jgi:hypothetical protein